MFIDVTVFNICGYLYGDDKILGEEQLQQVLSEFLCSKNADVERFLKEQSIDFTKKNRKRLIIGRGSKKVPPWFYHSSTLTIPIFM